MSFEIDEEVNGIPEKGDVVRTKKMEMEGTVEDVRQKSENYIEIFFRLQDGRLMKTPLENVTVIQKLADQDLVMEVDESEIEELNEISNEVLARYKTAAGKDASNADKSGNYKHGDKRFSGIVRATKKQFDNDAKNRETKEGTMSGINRWGPENDVSYEHILDEVKELWEQEKLNELSIGKLQSYKDAASSDDVARHAPLRKVAKHVAGSKRAGEKIKLKTGDRTGIGQPGRGTMEEDKSPEEIATELRIKPQDVHWLYDLINGKVHFYDVPGEVRMAIYKVYHELPLSGNDNNPEMLKKLQAIVAEQMDEAYAGPWQGDANKYAKAPKSSMTGSQQFTLSQKVQDTINAHGVKWAFEYYVKKHGMPPRHFQIYAGLTANPPRKEPAAPAPAAPSPSPEPQAAADEPKQSWWKKLRGKLPFEE